MPVLDHVRAGREVAERLQAKLPRVGRPVRVALRLRLEDEVVPGACHAASPTISVRAVSLDGPREIPAKCNFRARELILRRVIDIASRKSHCICRMKMIDGRLDAK